MHIVRVFLSLVFLFFASTALAERPHKTLVCHVSDGGNINLIEVAKPDKHIGNESHAYGTEVDYYPPLAVSSKEGKKDTDGDGVDDGCEMPSPCPCLPPMSTALGQAYLDQPLADARVEILNADGALIYEDITNIDGFFMLKPESLPEDFTVVVSGGTTVGVPFEGELRAIVEEYTGWESVGVNPLTTLIAVHHAEHDGESIDATRKHVREHLTISTLHRAEGLHLGNTETAYSASVFLAAAEEHSNFNDYIDHVSGGVHFNEPRSYAATEEAPDFNGEFLQLGDDISLPEFNAGVSILINSARVVSIFSCVGTTKAVTVQTFAGCVMGHGTSKDQEILDGLDEINSRLKGISDEINNLAQVEMARFAAATQQDWHTTIAALDDNYFHPARTVMSKLVCATFKDYSDATRESCRAAAAELAGNLLNNDMSARLANDLAGSQAGRIPDLRAMSNFARISSGRFFRNANAVSTAGTASDFIRDAWNFIDSNQALLVYVLVEYENAADVPDIEYINRAILYPHLGNPAYAEADDGSAQLVSPADRTGNCETSNVRLTNCRGFRERELRLVPRPLPAGAVVDTFTGLMWLQNIGSHEGISGYYNDPTTPPDPWDGLARKGLCSQHALSDPASVVWPATAGQNCAMAWRVHNMSAEIGLGFEGWRSPTLTELRRLVEPGLDVKPSNQTLDEWLSKSAGFYWIIDPAYPTPLPLPDIQTRWVIPEAGHEGPLERCTSSTQNCTNWYSHAWTSTSNGSFTPCEGPDYSLRPECTPTGHLYSVDLRTGTWGGLGIWDADEYPAWSIAVRKPEPCEFYYDDTSGPSPADKNNCQR